MIAWLSVLPRRHARRVVMVMVAMSQWSHFKGDSRAAAMPLSIYFAQTRGVETHIHSDQFFVHIGLRGLQ